MEKRIVVLLALCLVLASVGAVDVIIPLETYEFARGDNITLPCSFTTKSTSKNMVISWSVEGLKANAKETSIVTHYAINGQTDIKSTYEGRVRLDVNIPTGKANLKLSSITLADNKQFECRLLIPGDDEGKPADTTRLVVLVAPSKPICEIQGNAEYGQNINLTCRSEEGSPPPTYKWESRDVRNAPRLGPVDPRTTDRGGILSMYNISKETSGYYTCTSKNKIRSASCNITLSVMPPSINVSSTTIIVVVVIAVLLLLAIITFFCCRHHKKKKKEQEAYAMGVRKEEYEDKEEPPRNGESRRADGQEDNRDTYEERSERGGGGGGGGGGRDYEDRSRDNEDRPRDYDDRRSEYSDRPRDYDDRRSDYDDRRSDYDDRRKDYSDRRSDYDDRRSDYSDRRDERSNDDRRYDDARRYDDRRDRSNDDRYDEPYDERNSDKPAVPNNKPARRDYDD